MYKITIEDEKGNISEEIKVGPEIVIALLIEVNKQGAPTPPLKKEDKKVYKKSHSNDSESEPKKRGLTDTQKETIKEMLKFGNSVQEICDDVGVSNPTVYMIRGKMKADGELPME